MSTPSNRSRPDWPLITITLGLAFFFRFYQLADHPRGLFFDPAINGLDALRLMERGGHTLFFPTNGGRESLFIYLLIPFIELFGTTPLAVRLLTAWISMVTVALLYRIMRDTVTFLPNLPISMKQRWPLITALILSISYWHISISRLGQRPIVVPLLMILLFGWFYKGWHSGRRIWTALAGLVAGVGAYNYSAARLLLPILLIAWLPEIRTVLRSSKRRQQLSIFGAVACLTASPMGWYFFNYPAQFTARTGSVMVWNFLSSPLDILTELGRNSLRVGGFFCCIGSPNPIFGWPNQPGLHPILSLFLLIGLVIALRNMTHVWYRLILMGWVMGLLPSIIAIEAPHPLRLIVALVPTAILVGLGLSWAMTQRTWLPRTPPWLLNIVKLSLFRMTFLRNRSLSWPKAVGFRQAHPAYATHLTPLPWLLPIIAFVLPALTTFQLYFIRWPALQTTQGVYDYGAIAIRDDILTHGAESGPIYLPLARFNDSTLLFYLSGRFQRQAKLSMPAAEGATLISPEKNRTDSTWVRLYQNQATLLPPLSSAGQQRLQTTLTAQPATPIRTHQGEIVAERLDLQADLAAFVQQPSHTITATFGSLHLTGATYQADLAGKSALPVTLFWQSQAAIPDEYEILVRLVDDAWRSFGNGDARPTDWVYPTPFWRPNLDKVAAEHVIKLPESPLAAGRYWIAVSVFNPVTQSRLPLIDSPSTSPDTLLIGPLKQPLPSNTSCDNDRSTALARFGQSIQLHQATLEPPKPTATPSLRLTLCWQAIQPPPLDYTVFVHLLDEAGNLVGGQDAPPVHGQYPTTIWSIGEPIFDERHIPLPESLPAGQYRVAIGLYYQPTGERLPRHDPTGQADQTGRYLLPNPVTVQAK